MHRYFLLSEKDLPPTPAENIPSTGVKNFPSFPPVRKSPVDTLVQKLQLNGKESSDRLWHLYSDLLARYHALQRSNPVIPTPQLLAPQGVNLETSREDSVLSDLYQYAIETLPKKMQKKSKGFLNILQKTAPSMFSINGQLIDDKTGQEITGSNIIDLLHYLVRDGQTTVSQPTGWNSFVRQVLDNPSIPQNSFRRLRTPVDNSSGGSEGEEAFTTPPPAEKKWSVHRLE